MRIERLRHRHCYLIRKQHGRLYRFWCWLWYGHGHLCVTHKVCYCHRCGAKIVGPD